MLLNCGAGEDFCESLGHTSPGCSSERLMLRLKLQYFGHLMRRVGKDPDAGRDWGQEEGEDRG